MAPWRAVTYGCRLMDLVRNHLQDGQPRCCGNTQTWVRARGFQEIATGAGFSEIWRNSRHGGIVDDGVLQIGDPFASGTFRSRMCGAGGANGPHRMLCSGKPGLWFGSDHDHDERISNAYT